MRQAALGILILTFVSFGIVTWSYPPAQLHAQQLPPAVKPLVLADGLIALSSDTADGHQQVAVIDSKSRVMSVYHNEHKSGTITLKSVRSLAADLEMDEYNTDHPLPRDVRAILNKR